MIDHILALEMQRNIILMSTQIQAKSDKNVCSVDARQKSDGGAPLLLLTMEPNGSRMSNGALEFSRRSSSRVESEHEQNLMICEQVSLNQVLETSG